MVISGFEEGAYILREPGIFPGIFPGTVTREPSRLTGFYAPPATALAGKGVRSNLKKGSRRGLPPLLTEAGPAVALARVPAPGLVREPQADFPVSEQPE